MERLVIEISRILMYIVVVLAPVGGFVAGGNTHPFGGFSLVGALIGAVGAFVGVIMFYSMFAVLLQIEVNTRRNRGNYRGE
jgi:hypothetical protein